MESGRRRPRLVPGRVWLPARDRAEQRAEEAEPVRIELRERNGFCLS